VNRNSLGVAYAYMVFAVSPIHGRNAALLQLVQHLSNVGFRPEADTHSSPQEQSSAAPFSFKK
jgi:hypothetical protein